MMLDVLDDVVTKLMMIHDDLVAVSSESAKFVDYIDKVGTKTASGAAMMATSAMTKAQVLEQMEKFTADMDNVIVMKPKKDIDFYGLHPSWGFKQEKTGAQLQRERLEKEAKKAVLAHMRGNNSDPVPIPKNKKAHYSPKTYHKPRYTQPDLSVEALTGMLTRFVDKEVTRVVQSKDQQAKEATEYLDGQLQSANSRNKQLWDQLKQAVAEKSQTAAELKRLQERDASIARTMSTEGRKFRHDDE